MFKQWFAKYFSTFFLAIALCASAQANPSAYPSKPIKIIVPFAAGGSTDILARMTAKALSEALKQPVIVDNRSGASGNIGMEAVARAAPDGYTLLFTSTNLTLNPAVFTNVPYDPIKDFTGVTMLAFAPMVLVTRPDFGGNSLHSLIQYCKDHPDNLNFSSSGAGGAPHLAGELFQMQTGIKMTHVPYRGAAPAISDVVSGQVQMTFTTYISAQAMLAAGRLKAVAVASEHRLEILPKVPTFAEEGIGKLDIGTMFGLLAPAGTPEPILQSLYKALHQSANDPAFRDKIVQMGGSVVADSPSHYNAYLREDVAKWSDLIKKIGGVNPN